MIQEFTGGGPSQRKRLAVSWQEPALGCRGQAIHQDVRAHWPVDDRVEPKLAYRVLIPARASPSKGDDARPPQSHSLSAGDILRCRRALDYPAEHPEGMVLGSKDGLTESSRCVAGDGNLEAFELEQFLHPFGGWQIAN